MLEDSFVNGKEKALENEIISVAQEKLTVFREVASEIKTSVDIVNDLLTNLHRLVSENCVQIGSGD